MKAGQIFALLAGLAVVGVAIYLAVKPPASCHTSSQSGENGSAGINKVFSSFGNGSNS